MKCYNQESRFLQEYPLLLQNFMCRKCVQVKICNYTITKTEIICKINNKILVDIVTATFVKCQVVAFFNLGIGFILADI